MVGILFVYLPNNYKRIINVTMKRLRIALLLLITCCISAAAQFRYAPVVGVTITDLKFKQDLFNVDKEVGAQIGVQSELMFPGIGFGMDMGLIYTQMGAKTDLGSRKIWAVDGFGNDRVLMHTIQIPLHLRFKWTRMNGIEDYIAPFIYGGPDFTLNIAHNKLKGNGNVQNPYKYAGAALDLSFGGGFELWRRWQVSVQYSWGMTYLIKTRKLDNQSARNRMMVARVAYFF